MSNPDIIHNPLLFRKLFYEQVPQKSINSTYEVIVNVILYFVWIGITETRKNLLTKNVNYDLTFLCLATYKSFLPIIQNILLGNITAALILMRAHIEQIALLGYLQENRDQIPRYIAGEQLHHRALSWAKKNTLENWMLVYNVFSKVAHSMLENTSTNVMDESAIGILIQESLPHFTVVKDKLTDELLAGIMYLLMALETYNEKIIGHKLFDPKTIIIRSNKVISLNDLVGVQEFIVRFVEKHSQIKK